MTLFISTALAALAFAGPAAAKTWTSNVGEQAKPPAGTPAFTTLNQFFPAKLSIHAGDRVTYSSRGFHTVTFLGGRPAPALFVPTPGGAVYTGIADSAGSPFWFNGLPKLSYNVEAFIPFGGQQIDGSQPVSSGVIVPGDDGKAVKATLAFPKVGTFKLVCLVHPGMTQTVSVKAKRAKVPTAAAVNATVRKETAAAWASITKLTLTKPPANTVFMGIGGKATLIGYLPKTLTVKAGTTVQFVNQAPSEPHNIAFGPESYLESFMMATDLFPDAPDSPNQVTPVFAYGSEPPNTYVYDGANHGNGFLAIPLTDSQPGDPPAGLAKSYSVKFTKPGTYHFVCLLHGPDMSGDITVTS
jgi:plastocyanin